MLEMKELKMVFVFVYVAGKLGTVVLDGANCALFDLWASPHNASCK